MTALLSLIPRWVYAALIAMLAATSCKFKQGQAYYMDFIEAP